MKGPALETFIICILMARELFFYKNTLYIIRDTVDNLTEAFKGLRWKNTVIGFFISNEYSVSIKRSTIRPAQAVSYTIMRAIYAIRVVSIEIRIL